jgi:hypothetical protein
MCSGQSTLESAVEQSENNFLDNHTIMLIDYSEHQNTKPFEA